MKEYAVVTADNNGGSDENLAKEFEKRLNELAKKGFVIKPRTFKFHTSYNGAPWIIMEREIPEPPSNAPQG